MTPEYSKEAKDRIRSLAPETKKGIRQSIEDLCKDPYLGKPLQRELSGYWSLTFKRYRVIYKIESETSRLKIYSVGRREGIYVDLASFSTGLILHK